MRLSELNKQQIKGTLPFSSNEQAIAGLINDVVMTPASTKAFADESIVLDHNSLTNYEEDRHRKTTFSVDAPSGGSNGDMWIKYEE